MESLVTSTTTQVGREDKPPVLCMQAGVFLCFDYCFSCFVRDSAEL